MNNLQNSVPQSWNTVEFGNSSFVEFEKYRQNILNSFYRFRQSSKLEESCRNFSGTKAPCPGTWRNFA